ncbi:MAG TPA: DUF3754 domain-containing protein [Dehalococcoidia bacterium]|nr:DUF3754 domain-containing protein [Dehalococcoidia bacterium]
MTGKKLGLGFFFSKFTLTSIYEAGFTRPDNRFIPVGSDDLIEYISADTKTFGADSSQIGLVSNWLVRILEQEKSAFERILTRTYARINPDRETIDVLNGDPPGDSEFKLLNSKVQHMLEKANFEQLSDDQVKTALEAGSTHGIKVKLDEESLEEMSIWVRGRSTAPYHRRTLKHPIKGETSTVQIFNRLALITRPASEDNVQIRLFKDIPIRDVEALLPNANVSMGLRDAVMMVGSGAGAVWTVVAKVLAVGLVAASQLLWVIALPLAGLFWKVFSGYRRAIRDRDSNRAKHLYFQSLGANRSAIHLISFMICEEEIKEAVLLYTFCLDAENDGRITSESAIKDEIEKYLLDLTEIEVDFDIEDAIETVTRFDLWKDRDSLHVISIEEASSKLENHCHQGLSRNYHAGLLGIAD